MGILLVIDLQLKEGASGGRVGQVAALALRVLSFKKHFFAMNDEQEKLASWADGLAVRAVLNEGRLNDYGESK